MLNIMSLAFIISQPLFFSHFPIVKLSDFVSLNYLATTFFNVATVFSLKVANFEPGNYDIFPITTQELHR